MPASSLRTLAFEYLPTQRCLVLYQGKATPKDVEWDAYLELYRACVSEGLARIFVQSEGGRPSAEQQSRLAEATAAGDVCTAVVSSALALRFLVSSLALTHRHVRYFVPAEITAAFEYLQLSAAEQLVVQATLKRLAAQLRDPSLGAGA